MNDSTPERPQSPRLRERVSTRTRELLHWAEMLLAVCAVVVVAVGVFRLGELMMEAGRPTDSKQFINLFEEVLSSLLLLVVGIELAMMLVLRRPESLVEIMFFVIARKVLIKTDHVYELLIAVAAIGALFAIDKYLMRKVKDVAAEKRAVKQPDAAD